MKKLINKMVWILPILFVIGVTILWYVQKLEFIIYSLVLYNSIAFIVFGYDKRSARKGDWRIPEKLFFIWSFFGAGIGIFLGMRFFRHKTLHSSFKYGIPFIIILQIILVLYFLRV